jgi:hypothetical protein
VNQQSEKQTNSRSYLTQVQNVWRSLSPTVQNEWSLFANLNPVFNRNNRNVKLNGYQLFIKYNTIRLHIGLSILTTIAYSTITNFPVSVSFQSYSGNLDVIFDSTFNATLYRALIMVSSAKNSSYPLRVRSYKLAQFSGYFSNRGFIHYSYLSLFAVLPAVGQWLPYRLSVIDLYQPVIREGFFSISIVESYTP